jgi:hypothetical protein
MRACEECGVRDAEGKVLRRDARRDVSLGDAEKDCDSEMRVKQFR